MLPLVVVGARFAQFLCAMILLGSPLFFLYSPHAFGFASSGTRTWPRPLLGGAAVALILSAMISLWAQTAVMTDSMAEAFEPGTLAMVLTDSQFGVALAARVSFTIVAAAALISFGPSRALWLVVTVLGLGIVASFAWTGHGASDEGAAGVLHTGGDILHLVAAAVWIGALATFAMLLFQSTRLTHDAELIAVHQALSRFSVVGSAVVVVLLATGLVNTWFLVGPDHLIDLVKTEYGLLLSAKLALFALMLALAAKNRFYLTPHFGDALKGRGEVAAAVAALRRSVILETAAAAIILLLVSMIGTLMPPAAG
jgi:putative copper resistance protein D